MLKVTIAELISTEMVAKIQTIMDSCIVESYLNCEDEESDAELIIMNSMEDDYVDEYMCGCTQGCAISGCVNCGQCYTDVDDEYINYENMESPVISLGGVHMCTLCNRIAEVKYDDVTQREYHQCPSCYAVKF